MQVKRVLEAKLTLGDAGILDKAPSQMPTFGAYADLWLKDYARPVSYTHLAAAPVGPQIPQSLRVAHA